MRLPNFQTMFASDLSTSTPHRAKKSVNFIPGTNFEPGRPIKQWLRKIPTYSAGKHSCPSDLGGEWLDTSLMSNDLEQLLDLKVHALFHVRDGNETDALFNSFKQQMRACQPLLPGSEIHLRIHPVCTKVMQIYDELTERSGGGFSKVSGDEWRQAKVMVVYEDQSDRSVSFQFISDTQEDLEAHEYILELRRSVPVDNIGMPKKASLRKLRDEWLAEVCSLDTHVSER